jgi:hypothetical protein
MAHPNRNFVLAYILLVGLPVVGLVAVLKTGRTLKAPISVDGSWQFHADQVQLAALPCAKVLADADTALVISQSGKNFTLGISNDTKSTGSGVLEGTDLRASLSPSDEWSTQAACGGRHELSLIATVDPDDDPRSLVGKLTVKNCPSCEPVNFRATRQAPIARKASH